MSVTNLVTLIFNVDPVAKGRPRFGNGRTYSDPRTVKFENEIIRLARQQFSLQPLSGALEVFVQFYFKKAKSNKKINMTQRPDLDNLLKGVLDALNCIVYKDDCQIVRLSAEKSFSDEPRIEMSVYELET